MYNSDDLVDYLKTHLALSFANRMEYRVSANSMMSLIKHHFRGSHVLAF